MKADVSKLHGVPVLRLSGRLNHRVVHLLREQLHRAMTSGASRVILDLKDVPVMDSSAIGTVLSALVALQKNGGKVILVSPQKNVRNVLHTMRLDTIFDIRPSVEEAVGEPERGSSLFT